MDKIKYLLSVGLVLGNFFFMKAQVPDESFTLSGSETESKSYVARDYVKLQPNFSFKAEAETTVTEQTYTQEFESMISSLYYQFSPGGSSGPVINNLPPGVSDYVYQKYGPQDGYQFAGQFIEFLRRSSDFDPSVPVYYETEIVIPATTFKAQIDEFLTFDADYLEGTNPDPTLPFDPLLAVGSLPGSVDVSPTGAATYTIPISLPPGTAGMMPGLSIVYSSQSGGGMLGHGWSIGGFSAITRIPTNLHDDGYIDGVDFDELDQFTLDGNRLVSVGSSEYRTQLETYSKITSSGSIAGAPASFVIETKDGKTLYYGSSSGSRFLASDKSPKPVLIWLLEKVEDEFGNFYTISHKIENNEYYPKEIKYTGNSNTNLSPYNSIKFHFDKKSDPASAFIAGSRVNSSVILRELVIECEGSQAYKYEFKYKEDISSKLKEIIYSAAGSKLNSTKINWGTQGSGYENEISNIIGSNTFIPGDYNGDGLTDIAVAVKKKDSNGNDILLGDVPLYSKLEVYFSDGDGYNFSYQLIDNIDNYLTIFPVDLSGNGTTSLVTLKLLVGNEGYGFYADAYTYNGEDFSPTNFGNRFWDAAISPKFNFGDFNGDGNQDLVVLSSSPAAYNSISIYNRNLGTLPLLAESDKYTSSVTDYKIGDFNGNGKTDILLVKGSGYEILEYVNGETNLQSIQQNSFPVNFSKNITGDFNGDNKTDLLTYENQEGWKIYYNNGNGFIEVADLQTPDLVTPNAPNDPVNIYWLVSDLNNDGIDDIYEGHYPNSIGMNSIHYIGHNNYKKSGHNVNVNFRALEFKFDTYLDFNGDGNKDLLFDSNLDDIGRLITLFEPDSKEKLVTSITNGFNKEASFEYRPCNKVCSPGSGNDDANDVIEIGASFPVIASIDKPDAVGGDGIIRIFYTYQGLKIHKRGKGFLGFEKITSDDSYSRITTTEYGYNTDFFNTFVAKQTIGGSALPKEVTYTNEVHAFSTELGKKRFSPFVSWKLEVDEVKDIELLTSYTYDVANGNLTLTQAIHQKGIRGSTIIDNNFIKVNTSFKSKLESSEVTKKRPGKEDNIITTKYTYNTDGSVKTVINHPDITENKLTTEYKYNLFGLPYETSVSSSNESRTTKVEYDDNYRFVEKKTNPLLFEVKKKYDSKTGNILTETDILGKTTKHTYDTFGSLKTSTFADNNTLSITKKLTDNQPANTSYYVIKQASGSPEIKTYYNHLGKKVQIETVGFGGSKIYKSIEYKPSGQLYKKYGPSTTAKGGDCTTYRYYSNLRIYDISSPIGTTVYSYDGKTTTITDPSSKEVEKTINNYGEIATINDNGGDIIYEYNAAGLVDKITAPGNAVVSLSYDINGNKTKIIDPDAGTIDYTYDAFGNMKTQTDEKSNSFVMTYDKLNRLKTKNGPEGNIEYVYDIATNGLGQIAEVKLDGAVKESYEYDGYGRSIKTTEIIDSRPFQYNYTYDTYGRQRKLIYPSGFELVNVYENGYLKAVKNSDETLAFWEGIEYNEYNQLIQARYGNQQTVTKGYDDYHRLNSMDYSNYVTFGYTFEKETGNLESRTYAKGGSTLTESFIYDNLNRLDIAKIDGDTYLDMQYDPNGNIKFKDDAGDYEYLHPKKLHAVTALKNLPENTVIPSAEQKITYNGFNKVSLIEEDNYSLEFVYGLDQLRRKTIFSDNTGILKTKYFVGAYEEEITTAGTRKVHYIAGADGLAAVYIEEPGGNSGEGDTYYSYTDHLGSIVALADGAGNVAPENEQSFGPWGRRRNINNWGYTGAQTITLIDRGYTGHEHLSQFGIINMNGRLYDPVLGRMLSPDNYVQAPDFTQGFNRYSYCFNNPMVYIDPDGEIAWFAPYIIGAVVGAYIGGSIAAGDGGLQNANWNPGSWGGTDWWKGAITGGIVGAGVGALVGHAGAYAGFWKLGTPGVGPNTYLLAKGGMMKPHGAPLIYQMLNSGLTTGNMNMLYSGISTSGNIDMMYKHGLSGFAIGMMTTGIGGSLVNKSGFRGYSRTGYFKPFAEKFIAKSSMTLNGMSTNLINGHEEGLRGWDLIKRGIKGGIKSYTLSQSFLKDTKWYNRGFDEDGLPIENIGNFNKLGFFANYLNNMNNVLDEFYDDDFTNDMAEEIRNRLDEWGWIY